MGVFKANFLFLFSLQCFSVVGGGLDVIWRSLFIIFPGGGIPPFKERCTQEKGGAELLLLFLKKNPLALVILIIDSHKRGFLNFQRSL